MGTHYDPETYLDEGDLTSTSPQLETSQRFWACIEALGYMYHKDSSLHGLTPRKMPLATLDAVLAQYDADELLVFFIIHAFLSDLIESSEEHFDTAAEQAEGASFSESDMAHLAVDIVSAGHSYFVQIWNDSETTPAVVENAVPAAYMINTYLSRRHDIIPTQTSAYREFADQ